MQWNALVPPNCWSRTIKPPRPSTATSSASACASSFGYFELGGAQLMLLQEPGAVSCGLEQAGPRGKGLHFQVEVPTLADLLTRLAATGIALISPVSESWYRVDACEHGQRELFVADPDGFLFRFFEYLGERPVR